MGKRKNTRFKQCVLRKYVSPDRLAWLTHVAWLPEQFAVVGKILDIRFADKWESGWHVNDVGMHTLGPEAMNDYARDHKTQREASDI